MLGSIFSSLSHRRKKTASNTTVRNVELLPVFLCVFCVTLAFSDRPRHEINMWVKCRHSWKGLVSSYTVNQPQSKNKNALLIKRTFHIHVAFFDATSRLTNACDLNAVLP